MPSFSLAEDWEYPAENDFENIVNVMNPDLDGPNTAVPCDDKYFSANESDGCDEYNKCCCPLN